MKTLHSAFGVALLLSAATACTKVESRQARPPQPVKAEAASPAPAASGVRYSATIDAYEQVSLAFKASGYVDDVLRRSGADGKLRVAQPGDRIARGTVLARVRETDYRERVNQGRAKIAESDAALVKARLDLERARALFAADSLTKPDLDAAQASFDTAESRMAAARADLELASNALRDCLLIAPATATILERRVEVGTLAGAGTVGFVIGEVSSVKARFGIPDSLIGSVRPGDAINVAVEAVDATTFAGRVTAIAPAADPQSRVFDVEVTIPNPDGRLRPGMIGTVAVSSSGDRIASAASRPLVVPLTAIVRTDAGAGQFAVLIVEERDAAAIARMRRVELGEVIGNAIAVLKGIEAGERVVVSGATLLVDGDPVRVLP
jgi:RND family efflux transporter MFP subunit